MNLDNLNFVELNAQELQEVEGGYWWPFVWFAAETINNLSDSYSSFKSGYQASTR